jgi:hypothetical protein
MLRSGRPLTDDRAHGLARRRDALAAAAAGVVAAPALALGGLAPRSAAEAAILAAAVAVAVALQHAAIAARRRVRRRHDLVDGVIDPYDPAVAADVERLTGARARRTLARALRRAVADAGRPLTPALVDVYGRALRDPEARSACLLLADALERDGAADPRLVLRVTRLVCHAGSSLNGSSGRRLAEDATGLVHGLALAAERPSGERP